MFHHAEKSSEKVADVKSADDTSLFLRTADDGVTLKKLDELKKVDPKAEAALPNFTIIDYGSKCGPHKPGQTDMPKCGIVTEQTQPIWKQKEEKMQAEKAAGEKFDGDKKGAEKPEFIKVPGKLGYEKPGEKPEFVKPGEKPEVVKPGEKPELIKLGYGKEKDEKNEKTGKPELTDAEIAIIKHKLAEAKAAEIKKEEEAAHHGQHRDRSRYPIGVPPHAPVDYNHH